MCGNSGFWQNAQEKQPRRKRLKSTREAELRENDERHGERQELPVHFYWHFYWQLGLRCSGKLR